MEKRDKKADLFAGIECDDRHMKNIWDITFICKMGAPATVQLIEETEARLNITIPPSLKVQMMIQNGGELYDFELFWRSFEAGRRGIHWYYGTIEGILGLETWMVAEDHHGFDRVETIDGLHLLIIIAEYSDRYVCLDYRNGGNNGMPALTYVALNEEPTQEAVIAGTVDEFIDKLDRLRPTPIQAIRLGIVRIGHYIFCFIVILCCIGLSFLGDMREQQFFEDSKKAVVEACNRDRDCMDKVRKYFDACIDDNYFKIRRSRSDKRFFSYDYKLDFKGIMECVEKKAP